MTSRRPAVIILVEMGKDVPYWDILSIFVIIGVIRRIINIDLHRLMKAKDTKTNDTWKNEGEKIEKSKIFNQRI
ncbi:MAG: hypothetical protein K0R00_2757 [Herbinix sp.]|nr:hypothetical protein [Herbinix sp.]